MSIESDHPSDIISPCPLLQREGRTAPDLSILNDQERAYLEGCSPEDLTRINEALTSVADRIRAAGPQKTDLIQVPTFLEPLQDVLTRITNPLAEAGEYYETCARFLEELAALTQRIKTQKEAIKATTPEAAATPLPDTTGVPTEAELHEQREQAVNAIKRASQTLQDADIPFPSTTDQLAVIRFGLACVLLVMKTYTLKEIKERNLADKTTSLPTTYSPLYKAIEKLAKLANMSTAHMQIALGLRRIGTADGDREKRVQAATTILPMITVE